MQDGKPVILITGATGFLGGRIIQHLAATRRVFIKTLDVDITDAWAVNFKMSDPDLNADCVIHLASTYDNDFKKSLMVNTLGTVNVLRAAIRAGVKRFIYMSTVHVYGKLEGTITEETVCRPIHPYAITHKAAEDYVLAAHDKGEITGIVLRLSNSFGVPANNAKNAWMPIINNMCKQLVETGEIKLVPGADKIERDFITVTDVCRATEHFINLSKEKLQDGLFNVGLGFTATIAEAADWVSGKDIEKSRLKFFYNVKKLLSTGFIPESSYITFKAERDALLTLCRENNGVLTR